MGSNSLHRVFSNNPVKFKNYIDKLVRVKAVGNKIFEGTVYTIDPVSESVVLVQKNEGDVSIEFVFGHAILEIQCLGESIFSPKLFEEKQDHETNLTKKKNNLKYWLLKNMVPIEESEGKLILGDVLTILSPYEVDNCFCTNEIVLSKIQRLIQTMPRE